MDAEKIPLTEADTASYDSTAQMLKAAMAYVQSVPWKNDGRDGKIYRAAAYDAVFEPGRYQCLRCVKPLYSTGGSPAGFEEILRVERKRTAGSVPESDEYGKDV